jgi:hypothetical protein
MVDRVSNQSIDFLGERKNEETKGKETIGVMDYPTQVAIVELNGNYNKMVNNMFKTCASNCIKNFNFPKLGNTEKICAENCQKKFFESYVVGQGFVNAILEESSKIDLFSDKNEVDIVKAAAKSRV